MHASSLSMFILRMLFVSSVYFILYAFHLTNFYLIDVSFMFVLSTTRRYVTFFIPFSSESKRRLYNILIL